MLCYLCVQAGLGCEFGLDSASAFGPDGLLLHKPDQGVRHGATCCHTQQILIGCGCRTACSDHGVLEAALDSKFEVLLCDSPKARIPHGMAYAAPHLGGHSYAVRALAR